jgi:ABC-2 type transport system ATP-binding protein
VNADSALIHLQDVGLCYRLAKHRIPSFKEYAIHWMRGALRYEELWALDAIDLTVHRGESLGIVGRNGAGKSTLLKVISKVLKPTRGRAEIRGTLAPILELGTGFDVELSGHENIYLNGLLLGHSRRDIDERVDGIIEFSGLGEFIHSPIRNYSSGMLARLGFSIATAWTPDLLILDEVLAVGDAGFLRRCRERMQHLRNDGATVLMVSHSGADVRENTRRCVWLERGRIQADGDTEEVMARYEEFVAA